MNHFFFFVYAPYLSHFLCLSVTIRVTTSQVSSNKPQPVTLHERLAERFKLIGQKALQSSAKHSEAAGSAVASTTTSQNFRSRTFGCVDLGFSSFPK